MEIISYKLKELAELEGRHPLTIRNSNRYLKIRIETASTKAQYSAGRTKSPYWYRYIRVDDIKKALKDTVEITFKS